MTSQKTFTQPITIYKHGGGLFFGLASMCELVLCSEILSASEADGKVMYVLVRRDNRCLKFK